MELFKAKLDDIQTLDISENEKEMLNMGIYGVVEKLYKKYSKSLYELYGIIQNPKEYVIVLRGGSYIYIIFLEVDRD